MEQTTLSDRAVIRLSGPDVRGFLQGLVTNDVGGALPVWAGLLTPQGKALFDFLIWSDTDDKGGDTGDDLLLDVERAQVDAIVRRLSLYRLRRPIAIARDDALAVHWAAGGAMDGTADGLAGVPDPRLAALGRRWIAPPSAPVAGWPAHRLTLGVTEGIAELGSDRTLWLEANAAELNGVSFAKGCYVGQENTARMHYRSTVNRRLMVEHHATEPADARAWYPELGLAVMHRRVAGREASLPVWIGSEQEAATRGGADEPPSPD